MSEVQWGYAPAPPTPPPPKSKARGWIIAAVIALSIGCVLTCALAFSCQSCYSFGKGERIKQIVMAVRGQLVGHPNQAAHEADLAQLERMGVDDSVSFLAFGTLENRFNDVSADGTISHEEMDRLFELIHDIVVNGGNIDMARYPAGR